MDYLAFGDAGAPETVVILHASATGAAPLARMAEYLARNRRVLVPNLDGYGFTKIDCNRCPATFRHVQAAERFLTALGVQRFHLIGHSMGGLIALRIARRARFALRSLLLIEPMTFGVLDDVADKAALDFDRQMINELLAAVEAGTREEGLAIFLERVSQQSWQDLSERARVELLALIPQISEEAPLVSCDDLTLDDFAGINVPTLLVGAENGPPPAAAIISRLSQAFPDHEPEVLAGMGHMAPITHPQVVGGVIDRFYGSL